MTRIVPAPLPPLEIDRSPQMYSGAAVNLAAAGLVVAIIAVLAVAAGVRP